MSTTRRTLLAGLAALPIAPVTTMGAAPHPDATLLAHARELEAALARLRTASTRHSAAEHPRFSGLPSPDYDAAEAGVDAAETAWVVVRDAIEAIPARSVAGLALKIRACNGDPELDPGMMASVAADILVMDGGTA